MNMSISDHINNAIVAVAFGFGIFMPVALVTDRVTIATIAGVASGILFFAFMTWSANRRDKREGTSVRENAKTYMRRFAIAMGGYVVFLLASVYLLNNLVENQYARMLIAVLPILPVSYGLWAYMQWVRDLDEFQQKIQLEAIAFSLGMTGIITFTIGFLQSAGVPQPGLIWVFPLMIMFWGVGQFIAMRRYE